MIDARTWSKAKASESEAKIQLIADLLKKRQQLHSLQLEELVAEKTRISTRLLQLKKRYSYVPHDKNAEQIFYNSLAQLTAERRRLEQTFWREKMQLELSLQETIVGSKRWKK